MARDTELDTLKADMDAAFEQMKATRGLMNTVNERKNSLRYQMNEAFERMNDLHDDMKSAWQDLQSARSYQRRVWESMDHSRDDEYKNLTQKIGAAREKADERYSMASDAFKRSKRAYKKHNGELAKECSDKAYRLMDECHQYNKEFQNLVERRREVASNQNEAVEQLHGAKAKTDSCWSKHESLRSEFLAAKSEWRSLHDKYNAIKTERQNLRDKYYVLKSEFDKKHEAYIHRRNEVQSRRDQRRESDREIARKADVPSQYLDDVLVKRDTNGTINIYFGGYGAPDGPGHGHCCVNSSGRVIYDRQPGEAHGAQNFTNAS